MSVISEEVRGSGIQVIARAAEMLRLLQRIPADSTRPRSASGWVWRARR